MQPRLTAVLVAISLVAAADAGAASARNVLVVVNTASAESVQVGEHYARLRGIDPGDVVRLDAPLTEEVQREEYARRIEAPLAAWFGRSAAHDRILFIVLAKGIPLRVAGTPGRQGTVASVDSELSLLYRKMTGRAAPAAGAVPNPYFLGDAPVGNARPFSHQEHDIFLVTRLDGFSVADATALADRGAAAGLASARGRVVLDMKAALEDRGNAWLKSAADRLGEMGLADRVTLETTSEVVRDQADLVGYYSWGSNDAAIRDRLLGLAFLPGAVAGQFVSTDARTFREPPPQWKIGTWEQRESYYAGSPQSLTGDLIRQGVTGAAGYVAEPYLDATVRPDILLPAYLSGFTLAEAFYLALPSLSWQSIVVGDPLATVATLPGRPAGDVLEGTLDSATELPAAFSRRRLETVSAPGVNPQALRAWLRAQSREAKGDVAGARQALEEATSLDPALTGAQVTLAQLYEREGEHARAIARYRQVLERNPNDVVALNNLAYAVAVHDGKPADALPYAERAYTLSRGNPNVADTVAWVHHLLGNKAQSGRYIAEALRGEGSNAEVRLHAAAILAGAGDLEGAKRELAKALELDPELAKTRADLVQSVRAQAKVP